MNLENLDQYAIKELEFEKEMEITTGQSQTLQREPINKEALTLEFYT